MPFRNVSGRESLEPFLISDRRPSELRPRPNNFAPCRRRRWQVVGILAVILVVMIILPFSTITASLWKDQGPVHGHAEALSDLRLRSEVHGKKMEVASASQFPGSQPRQRSKTLDFEEMASKVAQEWPRESTVKVFQRQAVAADVPECSVVGNGILQKGGSAADAVIAAALCAGAIHPYSSGLGGGALIMYYNRSNRTAYTIDAREVAPSLATENMYVGVDNATISSVFGWHAIAVPGELAGMWHLHQRYGKLPWKELFQPALRLLRAGVPVTPFFARILAYNKKYLVDSFADNDMRSKFISATTGDTYAEGDVMYNPALVETLETIANDKKGLHEFYNGSIAKKLVHDIQAGESQPERKCQTHLAGADILHTGITAPCGGIIQMADLEKYHVQIRAPISSKLSDSTLFGVGLPSGNVIFHFILDILEGYKYNLKWDTMSNEEKVTFYHRFVEALKFGYANRAKLSDDLFVPGLEELVKDLLSANHSETARLKIVDNKTFTNPKHYGMDVADVPKDGGTAHISVLDKDGNAVAYSTSINTIFGSYRISHSTGIVLNNHMDDFKTSDQPNYFGVHPSDVNKIEPGKRPQSSICPLVITDAAGDVRIVAGGSGGTRIISGLLNVLTRVMFFGQDLKAAIDAPRLHHQLIPPNLEYERRFDKGHIEALAKKGHEVTESKAPYKYVYSAVEVIVVDKKTGKIQAVSDGRKGGLPDGV